MKDYKIAVSIPEVIMAEPEAVARVPAPAI